MVRIILILVFFLVSCAKPKQDLGLTHKLVDTFLFENGHNAVEIVNSSSDPARFTFCINDHFPLTDSIIQNAIFKIVSQRKVDTIIAAWMFTIENTYHSLPYTSDNWQHRPAIFLSSVGGGLCDDRASILASIWVSLGYQARVIGLTGHVVPEVLANGRWQMLDPDGEVYFCGKDGHILSVEELSNFSNAAKKMQDQICSTDYFCWATIGDSLATKYIQRITTTEDNQNVTEWHLRNSGDQVLDYRLPSNCRLRLIGANGPRSNSAVLQLSEASHGRLNLPLVPVRINGEIRVLLNPDTKTTATLTGTVTSDSLLHDIDIIGCSAGTEIEFLVNPKLKIFNNNLNSISISSNVELTVQACTDSTEHVYYQATALFFDTITQRYRNLLVPMPSFTSGPDLYADLEKQYRIFNQKADPAERDTASPLSTSYEPLKEQYGVRLDQLILRYQPKSVYYLFLAHTYNQPQHLKELMDETR